MQVDPVPSAPTATAAGSHSAPLNERRWIVLGVLCISLVTIVTAVSSLNVALPRIQESLDATSTQLQWILDSYALVFAGLLLTAGALGDRFGRKGALQVGLVIFGTAAFLSSQVDTAGSLIALRSLAGVGAALIMPATLSIIVNVFPPAERPKAVAIWAAFAGVGAALGPITSGFILEHSDGFGVVFFINLPLVAVLFVLTALLVPTSKDPAGHALDPVGAVLSIVGLVGLVFGVIEGPERGWTDVLTVAGFVVGVAGLAAFVWWESRRENPMLDPRLFRLRGFSTGSAVVTLAFFSMFGMFFLLTQYLQFVKGYSPLQAGVRVIPSAVMMMFWAPRSPKIVARFGIRRTVTVGFASTAVGFTLLALARPDTPYLLVGVALAFAGTGMAWLMPPASQLIVGSLPLAKAGVGSAVNDVTREVGGALGIAVAGSIVSSVYRSNTGFADRITDAGARELAGESVGRAVGVAARGLRDGVITQEQHDALVRAAGDAFNQGTVWAFAIFAVLAAGSAVVLGRLIPDRAPARAGAAEGEQGAHVVA
jgi:EmrB/QacA subfamily drug resistance transporter